MIIHKSPNPGENVHDETGVRHGPIILIGACRRGITQMEQIVRMNQLESEFASGNITQREYVRRKNEYVAEYTDPRNRRNIR